jgi:hypothetical protein
MDEPVVPKTDEEKATCKMIGRYVAKGPTIRIEIKVGDPGDLGMDGAAVERVIGQKVQVDRDADIKDLRLAVVCGMQLLSLILGERQAESESGKEGGTLLEHLQALPISGAKN